MSKYKIAIPLLYTSEEEKAKAASLFAALCKIKQKVEVDFEVSFHEGAESMVMVPHRRAEVYTELETDCTHLLYMDPDDSLDPEGFISSLQELELSDVKGIVLKEKLGSTENNRNCCRILVELETLKSRLIEVYLSPTSPVPPLSDQLFAAYLKRKDEVVLGTAVAHLTSLTEERSISLNRKNKRGQRPWLPR